MVLPRAVSSLLYRCRFLGGGMSRFRRAFFIAALFVFLTFGLYYYMLSNVENSSNTGANSRMLLSLDEAMQSKLPEESNAIIVEHINDKKWSISNAVGSFKFIASKFDQSVKKEMHIFYYAWYGNTTFDDRWIHWNHAYLPPPSNDPNNKPTRFHEPPEDIAANFYPLLGPYSSQDARLIKKHMEWMKLSGADVVIISWYPDKLSDPNGKPVEAIVPVLLEAADTNGLKIAFHIEPFENRNAETMHNAIAYLVTKYGNHSGMYKYKKSPEATAVPLVYVYDSYLVADSEWRALLKTTENGGHEYHSIRGTKYDAFVVGLCLKAGDLSKLKSVGFDGAYTYFAANGMTEGSTIANWPRLAARAAELGLLFIPSAGPGYDDLAVRQWNQVTTRERGENGETLTTSLKGAITAVMSQADSNHGNAIISLTSFNEWHEGTQIEPAKTFSTSNRQYQDYSPHDPFFYLKLTRELVENTWKHNGADQRRRPPLSARHEAPNFSNN